MVNKKGMLKLGILAAVMLLVVTSAVFVLAETYQDELSQLENDLIDAGYNSEEKIYKPEKLLYSNWRLLW